MRRHSRSASTAVSCDDSGNTIALGSTELISGKSTNEVLSQVGLPRMWLMDSRPYIGA